MTGRLWAALVISLLVLGCAGKDAKKPVTFADPKLEAEARSALGNPDGPLTAARLASVKQLLAVRKGIVNLAGIESMKGLRRLDLSQNQISELAPLAGLSNLMDLNLAFNRISDLKPLTDLYNVVNLDLQGNKIVDIAPLVRLRDLGGLVPTSHVLLHNNPLGKKAKDVDIPFLKSEYVNVNY